MGILEQVTQMKNQGINEEQIIDSLRQQGASPKQITDALAQAQIKNAVGSNNDEMQPSIMQQNEEYAPPQQEAYAPQQSQEYPAQYPGYYPQEANYGEYSPGTTSTDTIIEVAEQVLAEKLQKILKPLKDLTEFKSLSEDKIINLDERLKRIEKTIDSIEMQIIGKVSSYGDTLSGIKKEMSMMQDSFGKMVKRGSSESTSLPKTRLTKK